ncbi:hypothetical protein BG006_003630, partial [Podila minutissima]
MDISKLFGPGKTIGISRISMSVMASDSGDCQGDEVQEGLVEELTVAEGVDDDDEVEVGIDEGTEDGIEDGIEEQV